MTVRIINADVMDGLRQLPDESVHCCVTSPPYWGLRDYGVPGQIGLEATPQAFVDRMVEVFAEVRRALRDDGTVWLNLGDSYVGSGRGGNPTEETSTLGGGQASQRASMVKRTRKAGEIGASSRDAAVTNVSRRATRGSQLPAGFHESARQAGQIGRAWVPPAAGFKQKDLMGMPWRVALALQADGWWLRSDIIWSKPNPMPESVTDRPTKAHEYVFLLSKSEVYYYDHEAIKETALWPDGANSPQSIKSPYGQGFTRNAIGSKGNANGFRGGSYCHDEPGPRTRRGNTRPGKNEADHRGKAGFNSRWDEAEAEGSAPVSRNKRSVWTIATCPFPEAHFATFPPELPEICIKAGCPVGGTVLDPFGGAGTTGLVADRLQRHAILIELNPEYAAMAERRIRNDAPLFAGAQ